MTAAPRFSFLTTAYQTENLIRSTIDTVVGQTSDDWELIVVDNGNSDEMAAIINEYAEADPRIKLVRHENRGYVGGVMSAAKHATGDYLCVLDSDDQLMPGFCAAVGKFLDANPAVDAVSVDAYRFENDNDDLPAGYLRSVGVKKRPDPEHRLTMTDILAGYVPYYTAAIRREVWDAVGGYDPGIPGVHESVIIWLRLVPEYDGRVLPQRLARYRLRMDSLTRDPEKIDSFEAELVRSYMAVMPLKNPDERAALDQTLRTIRYWKHIRHARLALLEGDDDSARKNAREAFAQRKTVRAGAVVLVVNLMPGLMRSVHPIKQRVERVFGHAAGKLVARVKG